jgi:hypothetical protein
MPLLILTAIVQVALIVHVMRTGRATYWIFVLLFMPGIGAAAYFIVELLPELSNSFAARRAVRGVRKTLNPGGDLRRRELEHRLSGSVDATRHLADELIEQRRFSEAVDHYRAALTGLYEHDPDLMLGLAQAEFFNSNATACKETLENMREHNPDYRSPEGHLLYARALQECGELQTAEEEFAAVAAYYPGAEARVRYAQLLEQVGKVAEARNEYTDMLSAAELAPRHFKKAQKTWLGEARSSLARLS